MVIYVYLLHKNYGIVMKLILFSGDHSRHLFVNKELLKHFEETLVIVMRREELIPSPPGDLQRHEKELFQKHFDKRFNIESSVYGNLTAAEVFNNCSTVFIDPNELNTDKMANIVQDYAADFCFIFGVDLILNPVIGCLPTDKINLHLGLSPWYKGAATLYWPFVHLAPQFCGATFHQIIKEPDAGEIVHQCTPELHMGDGIHDVAAKCVLKAVQDIDGMMSHWKDNLGFEGKIQQTSGRNWRGGDFHASQLRIIYDLFDDKIVDEYLSGRLDQRKPTLFSCFK
jgi:folate-dependent phosphoribosylglycinamide formyltransferase PurN